MNQSKPPINEGEEHTGFVESVGEKGDGIVRIKGFVVFVPGVAKNDFVKIKIQKVLPKVSFGILVEKLEKPERVPRQAVSLESLKKKKPTEDVSHLLTTEGDSEDFGTGDVDDDEDDEDD